MVQLSASSHRKHLLEVVLDHEKELGQPDEELLYFGTFDEEKTQMSLLMFYYHSNPFLAMSTTTNGGRYKSTSPATLRSKFSK